MHQFQKVGGGSATEKLYETYEVKECPACNRMVKESYRCEVISKTEALALREEGDEVVIEQED